MAEIRLAARADAAGIAAIMDHEAQHAVTTFTARAEGEAAWAARLDQTSTMYPWFVALEGDRVVGFAKAGPHRTRDAYAYTVELTVFLHEDHRGKGLGRALYERLLGALHMQGYHTAVAVLTVPNPASEALHRKVGMKLAGVVHRVGWKFDRFHDTAIYEMQLQDDQQIPGAILPVHAVVG